KAWPGVARPSVGAAGRVNRWWRNPVAAVTANIEPGAELAGAIADLALAGSEVAVSALAGDDFDGGWQGAVLTFKLAQGGFAVVTIDIEHEDAADRAGGDADVEIRECSPPTINPLRIGSGGVQAGVAGRRLTARLAGENSEPLFGQF